VDVKLNLWEKVADVLLKVADPEQYGGSMAMMMTSLAPIFLISVNGSLDLEVDEEMKQKIAENQLV
jgi:hypothetical protein